MIYIAEALSSPVSPSTTADKSNVRASSDWPAAGGGVVDPSSVPYDARNYFTEPYWNAGK
jgi:hypothetical protein